MRNLTVLGSTGSIGTQALQVAALHPDRLRVRALVAGGNAALLEEQARTFRPECAMLCKPPKGYVPPAIKGVSWVLGGAPQDVIAPGDTVLNALVGAMGLAASMRAAKLGLRICLANKETLVAGGQLFLDAVKAGGAELLPVDSEHSAIHQCLQQKAAPPARIYLTASGGPFREATVRTMRDATPEQALKHPSWSMGPRVTIDSASMMNKALELIEAGHLFGMEAQDIEVLVQPTSMVHSMVGFADGSVLAQMGAPDMRVAILYALLYPERCATGVALPDFAAVGKVEFFPLDEARFPAMQVGRDVLGAGGVAGAVMNAADEVAVQAFLQGRCGFLAIVDAVKDALDAMEPVARPTLEDILHADAQARIHTQHWIERGK